jgi:hypothetical protein
MMRYIIIFSMLFIFGMAKSSLVSPIPLPKTYVQNLDPFECNEHCLKSELANGYIFSFLAHAPNMINDKLLNEQRLINISLFNIGAPVFNNKLRIAMLLPYKLIGRYASSTTTSVFAYLLAKNRTFEIKSFNIDTENKDLIASTLHQIGKEGFSYVIAPLTEQGVQAVIDINPKMDIFFPTINKEDVNSTSPYLYFGGINYHAQLQALLKHSTSPLVIFHDHSGLANKLTVYAQDIFTKQSDTPESTQQKNIFRYIISSQSSNLKYILDKNQRIQHGSFLMNTPVVKTGMVLSQFTLYDINSTNILSTQINYDPLILSMTQYQDRQNMIIANSVVMHNKIINETNALLNNDINYNWINYASTIGIDYFFHLITGSKREYPLPVVGNQIIYPIELMRPSYARFVKYTDSD